VLSRLPVARRPGECSVGLPAPARSRPLRWPPRARWTVFIRSLRPPSSARHWPARAAPFPRFRHTQRKLDVVQVVAGKQVEGLEDEPISLLRIRQARRPPNSETGGRSPVFAGGRAVQAADEIHQRRFPGAGRAHHGHELILANGEIHASKRPHDLAPMSYSR